MKTCKYQLRFYRDWIDKRGLVSTTIAVQETDLQILSDKPLDNIFLRERIVFYRRCIEDYISKDIRFLTSLKPVPVEMSAPKIVKSMSIEAGKVNVGPMAAVAGAIAQYLGEDLLKKGIREIIIENGGDIFLKTNKVRNIAIYAGETKFSKRLCLRIRPKDTPLGIATSSGTVGHSLNFASADAVLILAKDAILADAAATATSNLVESDQDFTKAINFAKDIPQIFGVVIILGNKLASWGKVEFTE